MEIKVTNFTLADHFSNPSLPSRLDFIYPALQEFKKLNTPVSVASKIVKSIRVVEQAVKDYNDTRVLICENLCEKDARGKPVTENNKYKFTDENHAEFNKKWSELLDTEVALDIFPVNQSELSSVKEINIACYETLERFGFIVDETKPIMNGKASKKELEPANA